MRYIYLVTCLALACSGTDPAAAPEPIRPAAELCFRVDSDVLAAFPAAEERLVEAGSAWGWPVRLGEDCASRVRVGPTTDPRFVLEHLRTAERSGAWSTGSSDLVLSDHWLSVGQIADMGAAACREALAMGELPKLLRTLLTHEIGHMVIRNAYHSTSETSVMYRSLSSCEDYPPDANDLALALVPSLR
jgi:hypothetical protein